MTAETDPLLPEDEDDALAAECALGVLEDEPRAAAHRRMAMDAGFAARVARWQERLAPLNDAYAPVPAPEVLARIEARLFPAPAPRLPRLAAIFGALAATAAALALAWVFLLLPPPATMTARLATEDAALVYQADFDGQFLTVTRTAGTPAPEGQVHELWIIAPDAAPVSLGLLAGAELRLPYPTPPAGWVLAVTVEPAGGAPGGVPSGPVIVSAQITS